MRVLSGAPGATLKPVQHYPLPSFFSLREKCVRPRGLGFIWDMSDRDEQSKNALARYTLL
jgi:hypothetical protein